MTRIVGNRDRSPFILDPLEAMKEGARVDAMAATTGIEDPGIRGVRRATHDERNALDWARMVRAAAKVQAAPQRLRDISLKGPTTEEPAPPMGRGQRVVSRAGFDAGARALVVQFDDDPALFGYANLDDAEVLMLEGLMDDAAALSRYVNSVIRPRHGHECVRF